MAQSPNLRFYNSLTKSVEDFESKDPGKVRMYNCGPTVYKRSHIGNLRRYLFSDFLRRTLELFGYEVRDVTNITDVGHLTQDELDTGEDKLEKMAREEKITPQDVAEKQTKLFMKDLQMLNIEPAALYPKATQHIDAMQELIAELIEKGYAYTTDTGVYFDVQKFSDYGKLSGNTLENIDAGARVDVREEKHHPADFALWKINDPDHLQQWDSPWGQGYPGWHIECSAMSMEYLGDEIDIHTGGEDNRFPHHENEIAQSEAATGHGFVRYWLHNRHLQISGGKMAKSGDEQITLDTLIEKGYSPLAFRLLVFGAHYRTLMDFSWEGMDASSENLSSIKQLVRRVMEAGSYEGGSVDESVIDSFKEKLADDLNTPEALAVVLEYVRAANTTIESDAPSIWATLLELDRVLGVVEPLRNEIESEVVPDEVQKLVDQRERAREEKKYEEADTFRAQIEKAGFTVEDTDSGPRVVPK